MLSHKQCEFAREATGGFDTDKEINEQFRDLSESEKEKIIDELHTIMNDEEYTPSLNDWREISNKHHWITHAVLVCVFMEWKSKQQK